MVEYEYKNQVKAYKIYKIRIKSVSQQRDEKWRCFNEDLQKFIESNDFYSLGSTYYEMANFVKEEGKDNTYLLKLGYEAKLKVQKEGLKKYKKLEVCAGVEIIAVTNCPGNNSCKECVQLNGKVFSLDEAILKNPLPVKNCSHKFGCRCVYGPTVN